MMNTLMAVVFIALIVSAPAMAQEAPLSLKDCYHLALARSENLGIQKELIKETEGLILQSLSTALPRVAFAYSEKWQDVQPNNTWGGYQPEAKFVFSQPIFTGFKEIAAVRASRHAGKQREAELRRAEQLLFIDVSDAYYLYLGYQQELNVQQDVHQVLLDRMAELKKRSQLGRSRASEAASAEAKLLRTGAAIEALRGQMAVAGQLLEFLVGRPVVELSETGGSLAERMPRSEPELPLLLQKAEERPDVVAAREALAVYKNNITAARSSFFPSVTVSGNSYVKRPDLNEGNSWDAILSVNVPIFNGLSDVGQVRQARAQASEAGLRLSQARRRAALEIRHAFTTLAFAHKTAAALSRAVEAANTNYQLQSDDFKRDLVNNLDVLQALEDLQSIRRDQVSAGTAVNRAYWNLKVATGESVE